MVTGGGYLYYKCRRCGLIVANTHVPNSMHTFVMLQMKGEYHDQGGSVYLIDFHICEDKVRGVTDLVGFGEDV